MGLFIRKSIDALQAEAAETGSKTLKRVLGPVSLVALGVGVIIGAGLFMERAEHTRLVRQVVEEAAQWPVLTGPRVFYTGANRIADSRRSLGLGLALCRSIVTAHGGAITVSDNVPHGAVFTFTLPAGEVELHE